jgi:hypothetical protein
MQEKPLMSKMSEADFASLVDVLPATRFLPDAEIKVRCEQIFDEFALSAVAKAFVPSLKEVRSYCRKVTGHAHALRKLLDPDSVQTFRLLYSVECIPDHSGSVQLGRVADLLPGLVNQLDWIIELCERQAATNQTPALWNFVRGDVRPDSATPHLVKELCNLFEETTRQVATRRDDGAFMKFWRELGGLYSWLQLNDGMVDHQLRPIIRKRKAKPNPPAVSDSTKDLAPRTRPQHRLQKPR